jgi:hypothetical protein
MNTGVGESGVGNRPTIAQPLAQSRDRHVRGGSGLRCGHRGSNAGRFAGGEAPRGDADRSVHIVGAGDPSTHPFSELILPASVV